MPLDENDRKQIEKYQAKLAPILEQARRWVDAIRLIYEAADEQPPPELVALAGSQPSAAPKYKSYGRAEFVNQPLATVVKRLLTDHGGLTEHELFDLMVAGGYDFGETSAERSKNGLKISLGKNMSFTKNTRGDYVLAPPGPRSRRGANGAKGAADDAEIEGDAGSEPSLEMPAGGEPKPPGSTDAAK